jgi:hypothetical protein
LTALRHRQASVVDDEVDAAEGQRCRLDRGRDVLLRRDIDPDRDRGVGRADFLRHVRGGFGVPVGHDHAGTLGREPVRNGPADARAAAGDECDPGRERRTDPIVTADNQDALPADLRDAERARRGRWP